MGAPQLIQTSEREASARRHKLDVRDFHRMAAAGILAEDDRVELIEGALFDMAPIGSRHAAVVARLAKLLIAAAGERYLVFVQNPLRLSGDSEPQPDLSLLKPRANDYWDALPQAPDALLVIEVADSSLDYDRDRKIPLYGKCGVPEAWLVDVLRREISVYRNAGADGYGTVEVMAAGSIAPECSPEIVVSLPALFS